MTLDAGRLFDELCAAELPQPASVEAFHAVCIDPAFERDKAEGREIETAYMATVQNYQRDAFIAGFNTAMQLIIGGMNSNE